MTAIQHVSSFPTIPAGQLRIGDLIRQPNHCAATYVLVARVAVVDDVVQLMVYDAAHPDGTPASYRPQDRMLLACPRPVPVPPSPFDHFDLAAVAEFPVRPALREPEVGIFGQPKVGSGLPPDGSGTERLSRAPGRDRALEGSSPAMTTARTRPRGGVG